MIAPSTLRAQRLTVVGPTPEVECPGCGRRTRDKTGKCSACRRHAALGLERMPTEQLVKWVAAGRAELERRRAAIDAAIGGAP